MKRPYTKPEVCVVRYSTSDMFCQCSSENMDTVKDLISGWGFDPSQAFAAGEPCTQEIPIVGYCKFTATENAMKVFVS